MHTYVDLCIATCVISKKYDIKEGPLKKKALFLGNEKELDMSTMFLVALLACCLGIAKAFPPFDGMANVTDRSATSAGKV